MNLSVCLSVLCLRHGISVWQHTGQSTTATSRHRGCYSRHYFIHANLKVTEDVIRIKVSKCYKLIYVTGLLLFMRETWLMTDDR